MRGYNQLERGRKAASPERRSPVYRSPHRCLVTFIPTLLIFFIEGRECLRVPQSLAQCLWALLFIKWRTSIESAFPHQDAKCYSSEVWTVGLVPFDSDVPKCPPISCLTGQLLFRQIGCRLVSPVSAWHPPLRPLSPVPRYSISSLRGRAVSAASWHRRASCYWCGEGSWEGDGESSGFLLTFTMS